MGQEELDRLLALVIEQAAALGIPVSRRICPHVAVNRRARTRLGCCRSQSGRHTIELSAPLLEAVGPGKYPVVDDMLAAFDRIEAMDEAFVAPDSLAREFIGGSIYDNH